MAIYANNKYTNWYFSIIRNAQNENRVKYTGSYYENHHIIPQSLGGDNSSQNLVLLTYKEHFLCHWMLVKMCVDPQHKIKMGKALKRMTDINGSQERIIASWKIALSKKYAADAQLQRWQDPCFRAKIEAATSTPEYKNRKSEQSKALWLDETYRVKHKTAMNEANNRPEVKERRSKASKESQNRPEVIEKNRQGVIKAWQDPERRLQRIKNMKEAAGTVESRRKNSQAQSRPDVSAKKKQSLAQTNQKPEVKEKRSKAQKAFLSQPGIKEKISERMKQLNLMNQKICPHCGKSANPANASRWHFDRCRDLKCD